MRAVHRMRAWTGLKPLYTLGMAREATVEIAYSP